MKPIYTEEDFKKAKPKDKLACQCYECNEIFYTTKHTIQRALNPNNKTLNKFCSQKCSHLEKYRKLTFNCTECNKVFIRSKSESNKSKNHFCSKSCAAFFNNAHKTKGTRRSKLEVWLEEQLNQLYPDLKIDYNKTNAINAELDIYIPSLNLAFELNGPFHYEPIYGINKLNQIQKNDISKSKACHDAKIDLCIIDTSPQKYVKPSTSKKYLDIINNIIKERLLIT